MVRAHASARYVRTSAQKAKPVMDLIRGRAVNDALATLRFARKMVARDIEKVLRSAIANAQQKDGFGGDVDRLYVAGCFADQGPSMKRIRPAPMGRAFRVVKRTAHLTVELEERPEDMRPARRGRRKPARRGAASGRGAARAGGAPKGGGRPAGRPRSVQAGGRRKGAQASSEE